MARRLHCIASILATSAAVLAVASCRGQNPGTPDDESGTPATSAPPRVQPVRYRSLDPVDAIAFNAALPQKSDPGPGAIPFRLPPGPVFDRAADCLTAAVYYEAAAEPTEGQKGVAQVVLNRVRHPAFPKSVCGVVYQGAELKTGCQFSFTCDGSLIRVPSRASWNRARRVATAALSGYVESTVGLATHYHANYVVPYWASGLTRSTMLGAHIFYRWNGSWGKPGAFQARYAGSEPDATMLRQGAQVVSVASAIIQPEAIELDAGPHRTPFSTPDKIPKSSRILKADEDAGILREDLTSSRPLLADLSSPGQLIENPAPRLRSTSASPQSRTPQSTAHTGVPTQGLD